MFFFGAAFWNAKLRFFAVETTKKWKEERKYGRTILYKYNIL